ncbi:MAG: biliverdin-producing heme oxygenase [Kofleriaceae bacterium]|nr:biliverdin-producing heme oxygenase [Kofleriaceae bacterium]
MRVNVATHEYHASADEGWLALRSDRVRRRDYVEQLVLTFGFQSGVESALAYTPGMRAAIDLRARSRAGLIAQDLLDIGMRPADIASLPQYEVEPLEDVVEGLGWMYVLERSTLHFDAIRRAMHRSFGSGLPTAFLSAYGGEGTSRWQAYGHALDSVCRDDESVMCLIAASRGAFRALGRWTRSTRPRLRSGLAAG